MKKYLNKYFASLFLVLTTFDMGLKQYVEDTFRKGEERGDKKVVLRKVHNKGFCLNTLDEHPGIVKSASAAICGMIGGYAYRLFQKKGRWTEKLGVTVLGAGAFSNTFDRIIRGYVVDYWGIRLKNSKLSKITANIADIYVVAGSVILAVVKSKRSGK